MNEPGFPGETLICSLGDNRRPVSPCSIVIFGASGDLTARKLIPALYHNFKAGVMPSAFRVLGVARREKTDLSWRAELREDLQRYSRTLPVEDSAWERFSQSLEYVRGDLTGPEVYRELRQRLEMSNQPDLGRNLLFYLATMPSQFGVVTGYLHEAGMLKHGLPEGDNGWQRLVVEKPFGHDLPSARELNRELTRHAAESQVFRIDHYLGKETVQNILMFRFSNAIFERLWNREAIDHVQITVSERQGVGSRGGYYEEAGALRDMVQNHILQVLSLVAMEPPVSLDAESIRDEKVKLLRSIRLMTPAEVNRMVVRGQYFAGVVDGTPQPGYRQEVKVNPNSNVETYTALKLFIDNWRWSGVPFFVRTGKSLPFSASEVRIQFRRTPHVLFAAQCGHRLDANSLTIRLQPAEGMVLRFNGKVPGTSLAVRPVRMAFSYDAEFGAYTPEAYERLLVEAMAGDATLFIRRDEVEAAWQVVDCIREAWRDRPLSNPEFYAAGTWGPEAANELLAQTGHSWHAPAAFPPPGGVK